MNAVEKRLIRAAEYRRLAVAASVLADSGLLAHVQAKHMEAAARWTALAILDEQPVRLPPSQHRRSERDVAMPQSSDVGDDLPSTP